jgi:glucose-6-phosphate isomerase
MYMLKKSIVYDYNNVLSDRIDSPASITLEEIESYGKRTVEIHKTLTARRKKGELPFYELPYRSQELEKVKKLADTIRKEMGDDFENLLVIGIGGSSLGGIALIKALTHPFHNLLPKEERSTPRVFYAENIDADEIKGLFEILDPEKTVVNIISKSGTTAEPMANFLLFQKFMTEKIGMDNFKKRVVATTDPKKGTMRQIVDKFGYRTLNIPEGVGGRFSVMTPVGLFPGYLAGIDVDALLEGAAFMDELTNTDDLLRNPAYINAVIHYHLHVQRGVNNAVLMPYSVALSLISDWYRQLLAESLGKKWALTGEVVYAGQTPIKAVGAIDQHSQVQLYREGPFDKVFTILSVENLNNFLNLPSLYNKYEGLAYLGGHTVNELFDAEKKATILALTKSGRPSIEITLPEINPHTIGQVFYLYEVQTVFAGYLYGINSLDQPGVEAGKQYTYGMLGRKGYEDMKKEADSFPAKDDRFILNGK